MSQTLFKGLSTKEFQMLCNHAEIKEYPADRTIFNEADDADGFYIVESGKVDISITKYRQAESIAVLAEGDCFGEMALFNQSRRTATARALGDCRIFYFDNACFQQFMDDYPEVAERIKKLIAKRKEELAIKESVLDSTGFNEEHLHVSIKGDPSLRETVFDRERYDSIVDELLPKLVPNIEEMLLERNVYRLFLNFNSGEVRACTIFDPFTPETHAANKLVSKAYLDRHFPKITYTEKADIIGRIYSLLMKEPYLADLSEHWQHLFVNPLKEWQPVDPAKIKTALDKLAILRTVENYYLRNISINTVQDVIRMQFNCDGTHIVNSEDYLRFLEENL